MGPLDVRLEHGDFINPDDEKYLRYRALVRKSWMEPIGHIVPGFFWKWLGEKMSHKSRKKTSNYSKTNSEKVRSLIRAHAQKVYKEKAFDLIVTGHMHIVDEYHFQEDGRKITSINLGTWLEKPRALVLKGTRSELVDLEIFLNEVTK
jgi:UDP-2,3-diacylglucosamine hydrolase